MIFVSYVLYCSLLMRSIWGITASLPAPVSTICKMACSKTASTGFLTMEESDTSLIVTFPLSRVQHGP